MNLYSENVNNQFFWNKTQKLKNENKLLWSESMIFSNQECMRNTNGYSRKLTKSQN